MTAPAPGPASIVTPEAVPLDLPLAGVGSRGVAYLLDQLIVAAILLGLVLAGAALEQPLSLLPGWVGVTLVLLLLFGVQLGYPVGFETLWGGRTPGKAALGLRAVTTEGSPVRFRHAAVRAALGLVDFQLTLGLAALLTAMTTVRSQRLGDLVAGTMVIRERSGAGRAVGREFPVPAGLEGDSDRLDVSALGPGEYQAIRSLLLRAGALQPEVRRRLAEQLATPLTARVRPAPPAGVDALTWLQLVAATYQRRHRGPASGRALGPGNEPAVVADRPPSHAYRPTGWEALSEPPRPAGEDAAPRGPEGGFTPPP